MASNPDSLEALTATVNQAVCLRFTLSDITVCMEDLMAAAYRNGSFLPVIGFCPIPGPIETRHTGGTCEVPVCPG